MGNSGTRALQKGPRSQKAPKRRGRGQSSGKLAMGNSGTRALQKGPRSQKAPKRHGRGQSSGKLAMGKSGTRAQKAQKGPRSQKAPKRHGRARSSGKGVLWVSVCGADLFSYDIGSLAYISKFPIAAGSPEDLQCYGVKKLSRNFLVASSVFEPSLGTDDSDSDAAAEPMHLRVFGLKKKKPTLTIEYDDDIHTFKPIRQVPEHSGPLAVATSGGDRVIVWNCETGKKILRFYGGDGDAGGIGAMDSLKSIPEWDGSMYGWADRKALLRCYDLRRGAIRQDFVDKTVSDRSYRTSLAVDIQAGTLFALRGQNPVAVWDPQHYNEPVGRVKLKGHGQHIQCSPDRRRLVVTASKDDYQSDEDVSVSVWDLRKLDVAVRHFAMPKPSPDCKKIPRYLTRVGLDEFVSVAISEDHWEVFVWNDSGKCTLKHKDRPNLFNGITGICTVGSPFDEDVPVAGVEWYVRPDEKERLGFLVEAFGKAEFAACVARVRGGGSGGEDKVIGWVFRSVLL